MVGRTPTADILPAAQERCQMAKSKTATEEPDATGELPEDVPDGEVEDTPEGLEDNWDAEVELDDEVIVDDETVVEDEAIDATEDTATEVEVGADDEALDELEAEELEMLTDDEVSETLVVDEAEELRAIRRAEIAMDKDAGVERASDEFVCQSCFLVLKSSQLADKRRKYCRDCAG
jgi:hypothetical protein